MKKNFLRIVLSAIVILSFNAASSGTYRLATQPDFPIPQPCAPLCQMHLDQAQGASQR
jgi:hypothetical protein